ncbi:MAG: hypothetical protein JWQ27_1596 [Ferruginibacter sp.]|nr:hypothetical protein [Ferruginibacter sp.]
MTTNYRGEIWKAVQFDEDLPADYRLEVSNHGRIRTFNKISQGNIIKGSMQNGYPIVRLKLFRVRTKQMQHELTYLQDAINKLQENLGTLKKQKAIDDSTELLTSLKKSLKQKTLEDIKHRTIYYQSLIHRLVAAYFVTRPDENHTVVAHLDYDKLNNHYRNLKWMTLEENRIHQFSSPYVIAEKKSRQENISSRKSTKLTVTKVMLLKKLLSQNKPIKTLVKQFKITETQILRIKRGENWGNIEAAR